MKWILKPNQNSMYQNAEGIRRYEAFDVCHEDGSHWCSAMVDAVWNHPDEKWKEAVYDKLRRGEHVTVELTERT